MTLLLLPAPLYVAYLWCRHRDRRNAHRRAADRRCADAIERWGW